MYALDILLCTHLIHYCVHIDTLLCKHSIHYCVHIRYTIVWIRVILNTVNIFSVIRHKFQLVIVTGTLLDLLYWTLQCIVYGDHSDVSIFMTYRTQHDMMSASFTVYRTPHTVYRTPHTVHRALHTAHCNTNSIVSYKTIRMVYFHIQV